MPSFLCKLVPPRPTFRQDMTPAEAAVMGQHVLYWKRWIDEGVRVFALGRWPIPRAHSASASSRLKMKPRSGR